MNGRVNYILKFVRVQTFFLLSSYSGWLYTVLKPSFLYGSGVWSSTSKANLDSILRLQKRAARVILNAPANSRSVDLFNTLNWVPFYSESHINQGALIYKRLKVPMTRNFLLSYSKELSK